jgi:cation diffusion facilitator CzcD-associated flavoprotein CzcO
MEKTVDKFGLRAHMNFNIACTGATWVGKKGKWEVNFIDIKTGTAFTREASVFVSAVGGISEPRNVKFPGMEDFKGAMFHTARWDHTYDYTGKRMAVIGNGCSAAQVVPNVVNKVSYVKQYVAPSASVDSKLIIFRYARSPQWYHERPNHRFTSFEKACFRYIPFWQRIHRLRLFQANDNLVSTYLSGPKAEKKRLAAEASAKDYIYKTTPKKYHDMIVPTFPLGCKRRIFDPDYLDSLHSNNLDLVAEGIEKIDATGITSTSGVRDEFDVIVLATGFQVQNFLTPMKIVGKTGQTLADQWASGKGAQAYLGTYVHNFPNFVILFGPNTFPAHNSALFCCEVQVEYVTKTLFKTLMSDRAAIIEVKEEAEDYHTSSVQQELKGSVFSAGCSNWYINSAGRNSASWPGYASDFWRKTFFPRFADYDLRDGDKHWFAKTMARDVAGAVFSKYMVFTVTLFVLGFLAKTKIQ